MYHINCWALEASVEIYYQLYITLGAGTSGIQKTLMMHTKLNIGTHLLNYKFKPSPANIFNTSVG